MAQHGTINWMELMTHDAKKACAFYGAALGWAFQSMDASHNNDGGANTDVTEHYSAPYHIGMIGEKPIAGIFEMEGDHFNGAPETWLPYMIVEDVDHSVEQVTQAGGAIMRAPFDIPGVGRIAMLKDPGGAILGFMTPVTTDG